MINHNSYLKPRADLGVKLLTRLSFSPFLPISNFTRAFGGSRITQLWFELQLYTMSGVEAAGLLLGFASFAFTAVDLVKNLLAPARAYRNRRFGLLARILYYISIFDADSIQELHRNINYWSTEDLRAWKDSYITSCNAISVAASLYSDVVANSND
jgi:hypothetical protein